MANNCSFSARIVGVEKENVNQFFHALQYKDFKNGYFMCRIFNAESRGIKRVNDAVWVREVAGDCAWSASACLITEDYGRYRGIVYGEPGFGVFRGRDGHICYANIGVTSPALCKLLSCGIEIWGQEPDGGFQEHFIFDSKGDLVSGGTREWDPGRPECGDSDHINGFPEYEEWERHPEKLIV